MALRLDDEDPDVYLSCVGTFGIGSASYWWSRLMGIVARTSLSVLGRAPLWQLLYADDVNWLVKGVEGIRGAVLASFIMVVLGTPFSWPKVRAGFLTPGSAWRSTYRSMRWVFRRRARTGCAGGLVGCWRGTAC